MLMLTSLVAAFGVEDVEQDLDHAARSLERIDAALADAERDIAAAEVRLQEATTALEAVEDELAEAQRAADAAERTRQARSEELDDAQEAARLAEAAHDEALGRLQDRSVEVFKYGTGRPQQALVTGVMGATDWHEVAVTTSTVSRIVQSDRSLLTDAAAAEEAADRAHTAAVDAKLAATVAEEEALTRSADLLAIVDEHEAAVAAVEQEHAEREAVLAELQEDGELAALLVATLEDELARALEQQAAEQRAAAAAEAEAAERAAEEAAAAAEEQRQADDGADGDEGAADAEGAGGDEGAAGDERGDEGADGDEGGDEGAVGDEGAGDPPPPGDGTPAWASRLPASGQPWAADIDAAARAHGVDGRLFAALVWTESHFRPDARSRVGAIGLAQLMPGTAAWLGVDPTDPIQNLDGGARYLAMQHHTFGSLELALAAYNAGPTPVRDAGPGIPNYVETQLYVVRVLERYNHLAG